LRKHFRYWKPIQEAKKRVRRLSGSKAKGEKWEYKCHICSQWHFYVEVDHIIPVGSLRSLDDLAGFVERLTEEDITKYRVLCKDCHNKVTQEQRIERSINKLQDT
jgi:5-methylcytosine-specific restriction endonuclease McrA